MSESGNDGAREAKLKNIAEGEAERERHKERVEKVIERLNAEGFVREGESLKIVFPTESTVFYRFKWVVRVEVRTLADEASIEERRKRYPDPQDRVAEVLKEEGYSADVDYDREESVDGQIDHMNYNLREEEKK